MNSASNLALLALFGAMLGTPRPPVRGTISMAQVTGHLKVLDRGGQVAQHVEQAVLWLEPARGNPPPVTPGRADITTEHRTFSPHVTVVAAGSTVRFPNRDGFNHNVFSLTEGDQFDLGLYDRGEGKTTVFATSGIVNVFCNVHSTMSAIVVVRSTPWYTQPTADGSFAIGNVPPGEYVLRSEERRVGKECRSR